MEKPRLLLDIDDTLCPTGDEIASFVQKVSDITYTPQQLAQGRVSEKDSPHLYRIRQLFLRNPESLERLPIYPWAHEAVSQIARFSEIHIVSARIQPMYGATIRWLIQHNLFTYIQGIHLRAKVANLGETQNEQSHTDFKLEVARDLTAKALVDDDVEICRRFAQEKIFSCVMLRREDIGLQDGPFLRVFPHLLKMAHTLREFPSLEAMIASHNQGHLN